MIDREGTGRVSSFCFYVALTTGVVLAALMMLFRVPLLGILGATAETMPHAQAYYTVLAIGAPATVLNFIHSNLVRCEGMATQSMIGSSGGTVINIILDPILITTVGWGARGAAIATIGRQSQLSAEGLYFLNCQFAQRTEIPCAVPVPRRIADPVFAEIAGVGHASVHRLRNGVSGGHP